MHRTTSNSNGTPHPGRPCGGRTRGGDSSDAPPDALRLGRERLRPTRREIECAALELVARRGREILTTAQRYAADLDDAEDAYQRGLEILLTKAPTTREVELVRWLKTVVKHEAFNLRRQRERHAPLTGDGELAEHHTPPGITHDQVERYERLRQGAEALAQLKPQEARALRLKAEGYSYKEICEITDWTYTKVNRCLTEGRRSLRRRAAAIAAGEECERLAPLLSDAAGRMVGRGDGELERHLRNCLNCRAGLRSLPADQCGSQNERNPKAFRESA